MRTWKKTIGGGVYDTLHFNMRSIVESRKGGLSGHEKKTIGG